MLLTFQLVSVAADSISKDWLAERHSWSDWRRAPIGIVARSVQSTVAVQGVIVRVLQSTGQKLNTEPICSVIGFITNSNRISGQVLISIL